MAKSVLDWIALILVIIGGLNWGLVAFDSQCPYAFNLVSLIFGEGGIASIIYVLLGLAALYTIYYIFKK